MSTVGTGPNPSVLWQFAHAALHEFDVRHHGPGVINHPITSNNDQKRLTITDLDRLSITQQQPRSPEPAARQ
ncbi:MAG TPA: hypothetical protein VJA21_20445 [Verrucomicrobiae bacterium]